MNALKSKMQEKIELYSREEYLNGYIRNEFMTDDKDADIYLHITDKSELFDSRTHGRQIDLKPDIYEYIEKKSSMLDSDIQIELHISGIELTQHEEGIVRHLVKEHYAIELYKVEKEFKKIRNKICKLMLLGIISLFFYIIIFFNTDFQFGIEILGFLFSFSLWEGFTYMINDYKKIKSIREDTTQNLLINVVFKEQQNIKEE